MTRMHPRRRADARDRALVLPPVEAEVPNSESQAAARSIELYVGVGVRLWIARSELKEEIGGAALDDVTFRSDDPAHSPQSHSVPKSLLDLSVGGAPSSSGGVGRAREDKHAENRDHSKECRRGNTGHAGQGHVTNLGGRCLAWFVMPRSPAEVANSLGTLRRSCRFGRLRGRD